MTRRLVNYQL